MPTSTEAGRALLDHLFGQAALDFDKNKGCLEANAKNNPADNKQRDIAGSVANKDSVAEKRIVVGIAGEAVSLSAAGSRPSDREAIYVKARRKFNIEPEEGIRVIRESCLTSEDDTKEVARFLKECTFLDKRMVGEYLGEATSASRGVLLAYAELFDFTEMSFEAAFRHFLSQFQLPGEAQKIDRVVLGFASRFHQQSGGMFRSVDVAYVLAFSLIILNTDLHNPSVPRKISKIEFIRNNQGIDNGSDLPADFLASLYDSIACREIVLEGAIDGTHDALYAFHNPKIKGLLWKRGGRLKTWHRRWCLVSNGCFYYFRNAEFDGIPAGLIPLEDLVVTPIEKNDAFKFVLTVDAEGFDSRSVQTACLENAVSQLSLHSTRTDPSWDASLSETTINSSVFAFSVDHPTGEARGENSTTSVYSAHRLGAKKTLAPMVKSAKYVNGAVVQGTRDKYVFMCSGKKERDDWVDAIRASMRRQSLMLSVPTACERAI